MAFDRGNYEARKEHGLCVRCKGEPIPGRATCRPCVDVITQNAKDHVDSVRAAKRKYIRQHRLDRTEEGRCTEHGCNNMRGVTLRCDECRRIHNLKASKGRHRCHVCRTQGHNRRTCPLVPAASPGISLAEFATARRAE
jgi:hypothetical protein